MLKMKQQQPLVGAVTWWKVFVTNSFLQLFLPDAESLTNKKPPLVTVCHRKDGQKEPGDFLRGVSDGFLQFSAYQPKLNITVNFLHRMAFQHSDRRSRTI